MRRRSVFGVLIVVLTTLMPVTALAQVSSTFGNFYSLSAQLRGDTEIPPGDSDGFGYARITVILDSSEICFQISVARIEPASAAHIHSGVGGSTGPVVIPLEAPSAEGFANGCVTADAALLVDIVTNPWNYYVNVHNGDYPAGALRGQLEAQGRQQPPPPPPAEWESTTIVEGLANPKGVHIADDGAVYIAEAGSGGEDCIDVGSPEEPFIQCFGLTGAVHKIVDGIAEQIGNNLPSYAEENGMFATGPHDVATDAAGNLYVITGLFAPAAARDEVATELEYVADFGKLFTLGDDGNWEEVADIAAWESENNPDDSDAEDGGDSNPFGLTVDDDTILVVDASGNSLLAISSDGTIAAHAIFPEVMVEAPDFLELPEGELIPMQAVPTSIAIGPDGAYYVSQLTGFPFPVGGASIWRIEDLNDDGDALDEGEVTVYADGLTSVVGIDFGDNGTLYAVEFTRDGLLAAEEDLESAPGAVVAISTDGTHHEILTEGLVLPGGVAVGQDGSLYVTNRSIFPDTGEPTGGLIRATPPE